MYKSLVQLKGRNGLYIVPSLTFWFFCVKTKEHIHKKLYKFVSFVQLSLLTFLCLDASRVGKGIAARAAHGTVLETLASYGSCYLILFYSKFPMVEQNRYFFFNSFKLFQCFSF